MKTAWYQLSSDEALSQLGSSPETGLGPEEAAARLEKNGPNELIDRGGKGILKILLEQLTGPMVIILGVSAAVSVILQHYKDAVVILVIVVLNTILGFTQEYRAEKAMEALKKMAVPRVKVKRGGHVTEISARELVPGDIIQLEAGNSVPADGRLLESINLHVQEAVLTGESEPVEKKITPLTGDNLVVGDRRNSIFSGTIVTYGRGTAVITETGMNTELGKIAAMLQSVGVEATPLQRRLAQVGKYLAIAAIVIVLIVIALGVLRGDDFRLLFMTAISMAVAAVPEGLPTVVTIALSLGAQRMLKRKALIRKLPAVETLGSVTVICSDKTGTLTENRMTVTVLDIAGLQLDMQEHLSDYSPTVNPNKEPIPAISKEPSIQLLLMGGALCNDAILEPTDHNPGEYASIGDPTEGALVIAAAQGGLWKADLEKDFPRVAELPFDSDRKRMTTIHAVSDFNKLPLPAEAMRIEDGSFSYLAFSKGSVDGLLALSTHVACGEQFEPINEDWRRRIQEANDRLASNGMRILGICFQPRVNAEVNDQEHPLEEDLIFIGLVAMIDPARSEVKAAVATAQEAGVRSVMITGDHPLTAAFIARELGILKKDDHHLVMTGQELDKLSVAALEKIVEEVVVYARVSPEHKLKIVQALQKRGHIAAMTGDGVNDAPALKKADIGVAMGITGTDVSKEAADVVLLDDNFATIVAAVEEGRRIYENIRKFIKYTLTSNAGEIWVMLAAPFLGMPLPLLPLQILWINLVTDGLPGLALTVEPADKNTMKRPPHAPKEGVFARGLGRDILWIGLLMGAVSLGLGYWAYITGHEGWQTMIFTTITLSQMGNVLALRSERESVFSKGFMSNKLLLASVVLTTLLQMAVIYVPFLQGIFKTSPLSVVDLSISLGMSLVVFFAVEAVKWGQRRWSKPS